MSNEIKSGISMVAWKTAVFVVRRKVGMAMEGMPPRERLNPMDVTRVIWSVAAAVGVRSVISDRLQGHDYGVAIAKVVEKDFVNLNEDSVER